MVEPSSRFTEIKIPLVETVHGLDHVSGVLGVPRWWPTGARVSVVLAHGSNSNMDNPLIESLQRELTERRNLTLRFNFPFAEAKKKRPDAQPVLRRTLRAAIGTLAADPTAAPAHLFLGGLGLGAQVAAVLAGSRVRVDGLFLLGFPLPHQNKPEEVQAALLYRVVAPILFVQGTRDKNSNLDVLRRTLARVGAPTTLIASQQADHQFKILKKSERTLDEVHGEVVNGVDGWIQKVLES